eukprot:EG_transcript_14734
MSPVSDDEIRSDAQVPLLASKPVTSSSWRRHVTGHNGLVLLLIVAKVMAAVASRVSQKIMLVPMKPFAYFVANLMALVYVVVYGLLLAAAYMLGRVTKDGVWSDHCLGIPKAKLILLGACDTVGSVLIAISASQLGGPFIVILGQAILPASMAVSYLLLGTTYSTVQGLAVGLVVAGVAVATALGPPTAGAHPPLFCLLMAASTIPYAISFTLKEQVFRERPGLHVLVVNFFSSVFQLCFAVMCLPVVSLPQFGGVPPTVLPAYVRLATRCVLGADSLELLAPAELDGVDTLMWTQCHYMPGPLLVYIVTNITMNILVLTVVKHAGAVLNFVLSTVATTLQYFAFVLDWPLLPRAKLAAANYVGFGCAVAGLVLYR